MFLATSSVGRMEANPNREADRQLAHAARVQPWSVPVLGNFEAIWQQFGAVKVLVVGIAQSVWRIST